MTRPPSWGTRIALRHRGRSMRSLAGSTRLVGEHLADDRLDLHQREVPAEAVLAASSPRQPGAGGLLFVDEALWA